MEYSSNKSLVIDVAQKSITDCSRCLLCIDVEGIRCSRVFVVVYERRDQCRKYFQIRHPNLEKHIHRKISVLY